MVEDNTFSHLIVVGASAGGIEALTRLVTTLPEDLPAPIVIAQHLDPERASHLEQILSRSSTLPVRTITDNTPLESTRNLSMKLRRPEVSQGLEAALSDLLSDVIPPSASFELSAEGDETPVPPEARTQVFLILREAIRNAVTHSECSRIKVRLQFLQEEILGSIEDDGRGFDSYALHPADHSGLKAMEERASLLGGTLGVSSNPGKGTVKVTVPLGARDGGF